MDYNRQDGEVLKFLMHKRFSENKKYRLIKGHVIHSQINALRYRDDWITENCVICNSSTNIEMHHPNENIPLHVYWLCHKHHLEQHGKKLRRNVIDE